MTAMRVILVGLGARGRTWLEVAARSTDVALVGLCDPDPDARARAAERVPDAAIGAGLAQMVGIEADAVILCTPPTSRLADLELCCRHGWAVLAEKPLAASVAEARELVAMADSAAIPLMVGLNFRFLGVTRALRRLLDERVVGAAAFARFTYERWRDGRLPHINSYPLTMDQPMAWEQTIHHVDLMRYVYRREPMKLFARTSNPSWSMYRDDANISALIEFDGGFHVNYQGTWQSNWRQFGFEWRTECDGGVIIQRDMFGRLAYARRDDETLSEVELPPHEPWITDAEALLAAFTESWRGRAPWQCTGRDHLVSLAIVEAIIASSRRRQAVDMAEFVGADAATPNATRQGS